MDNHGEYDGMNRFLFSLAALLALPQAAWPQTPAPSGFAPQAQTAQGVTVRLSQAQWRPLAEILGSTPGVFIPDQTLVISGTVTASGRVSGDSAVALEPGAALPEGKTQMDFVDATLQGPQGQRRHGLPLRDGSGWYFDGLDPRWNTAQLQFERTDPAGAPGAALGNFPGSAAFSHIAVPLVNGPPVTVHQTLTTDNGSRITLEKIRLRRIEFGAQTPQQITSDQMQLLLTWQPPAARPDTRIRFTLDGQVTEENGDIIGSTQGDGSESNNLDAYRDRLAVKYAGTPFTLNLHLTRPPAAGVKTLTISASYWEAAPALRRATAFTRFTFPLALAHLAPPAHSAHHPPVATQQQGDLLAVVEDVRPQYSQENVRLWFHDAQPQNEERSWWIAQAGVQDPKTGQQQSVYLPATAHRGRGGDPQPDYRLHWKADGEPPGPNDAGYRLDFAPYLFHPRPASVTLNLALELRRRIRYAFDLSDLPVPAPGVPLPVSRRAVVPGLGAFDAEAIMLFGPDHPLQTRFGRGVDAGQGQSGMALALKFTPEKPDAPAPDGSLLLGEMTTRDLPGSEPTRAEDAAPIWANLVDQTSRGRVDPASLPKVYFVTLPLLPAPAGKTAFTLHVAFDQVQVTDRRAVALTVPVFSAPPVP